LGMPSEARLFLGNCEACKELLQHAGAESDGRQRLVTVTEDVMYEGDSMEICHVERFVGLTLMAAACGDVEELIAYSARGINLFACDYDKRTALHLAASNGHLAVIKYLLSQASDSKTRAELLIRRDRFGATAIDDARRENHQACLRMLQSQQNPVLSSIDTGKLPSLLQKNVSWDGAKPRQMPFGV